MPAWRAAAPPAGTESDQNVMLCGPPDTLVKRTVAPAGIVIEFGSNPARVLPLPVIFTSTTGPVVVAAAGAAGGALWVWFWSPFLPQATALMATTVVSKAKRIAELLRGAGGWGWELGTSVIAMSLVNCFTIAVNIEGGSQNGSPTKALVCADEKTDRALCPDRARVFVSRRPRLDYSARDSRRDTAAKTGGNAAAGCHRSLGAAEQRLDTTELLSRCTVEQHDWTRIEPWRSAYEVQGSERIRSRIDRRRHSSYTACRHRRRSGRVRRSRRHNPPPRH